MQSGISSRKRFILPGLPVFKIIGDVNGEQDIYIAKLKNPWTIEGNRVRISASTYDWEKYGDLKDAENPLHVNVNEGPQILEHKGKLFLVYSASGCWTDHYG